MTTFPIDIEVTRAGRHARWVSVTGVVVDSGAEVSWLPESVLRDLGIGVFKKSETFVTADGRHVRRDVGIAVIHHGSFKTVDEVVLRGLAT